MRHFLVIRLHGDAQRQVSWAIFDSGGFIIESATNMALELVPLRNHSPVILVPSTELLLTQVDIPSKQWQRIVQAIPYALEEQLAEDIETLHFAVGQRVSQTGEIALAIIANRQMEAYLQQLNTVGITPTRLIPDILVVPQPEAGWGIVFFDNVALVRIGLQAGFAIETIHLKKALSLALVEHQAHPPQQLVIYNNSQQSILDELSELGIPIEEKNHDSGALAWLIPGLLAKNTINLIQGKYHPQNKIKHLWRPWRLTAALVLLWLTIQAIQQSIFYHNLRQQQQILNTQIVALYRKTVPQARKIVNPRVQMEQQLTALQTQHGQYSKSDDNFLELLNSISIPLVRTPGFDLKRLDYQQGRLNLQIEVANLQALESLKLRLKNLEFAVEILTAVSRNNRVESRLRIEKS
jgi:general secretion pathway protein L